VAGLRWWLAAADRHPAQLRCRGGRGRAAAGGVGDVRGEERQARGVLPWFAALTRKGVRWRGRLLGPVPAPQSSAALALFVYDVLAAVLTDCTCPLRPV
jgi:hypothetical protein